MRVAATTAALLVLTFAPAKAAQPPVEVAPPPQARSSAQLSAGLEFAVIADADGRYEANVAGTQFTSRDEIEGYLLYRTAQFVRARGGRWFRFLHLPGERGDADHPAGRVPSFGAAYAHWQPHWTYRRAGAWQPWRPEWRAPFWTETEGLDHVDRFEAHAMIEIRAGAPRGIGATDFDSERVVADLRHRFDPAHRH